MLTGGIANKTIEHSIHTAWYYLFFPKFQDSLDPESFLVFIASVKRDCCKNQNTPLSIVAVIWIAFLLKIFLKLFSKVYIVTNVKGSFI